MRRDETPNIDIAVSLIYKHVLPIPLSRAIEDTAVVPQ